MIDIIITKRKGPIDEPGVNEEIRGIDNITAVARKKILK
jgi:hypothetical protein